MRLYWNRLFDLNEERSIWVLQEELGKELILMHRKAQYRVKIPKTINKKVSIRLRGLGKKRFKQAGDLILHVWLNKGTDARRMLWLPETAILKGTEKIIWVDKNRIQVMIPPHSHQGLVLRLKGMGKEVDCRSGPPLFDKNRGDLYIKLFGYPETVTPQYGSFENLGTDDMANEGWIYRKIDDITKKMGKPSFSDAQISADDIADKFNEQSWYGIYTMLINHLKLTQVKIHVIRSNTIKLPGKCERTQTTNEKNEIVPKYVITVKRQLMDNPFMAAAILAHELCHVIFFEKLGLDPKSPDYSTDDKKATLEMEHTVDLLVFMHKIGEFQLRVARDCHLTIGYFRQEMFERMQVIVSRKLKGQVSKNLGNGNYQGKDQ